MSIIKTGRMILRPFEQGDAEAMFRNWTSDEEVARYCRWYRHKDIKSTRFLLHSYLQDIENGSEYRWGITLRDGSEQGYSENEVVGAVEVVDTRDNGSTAELGYVITRALWSRGYMTEAVKAVIDELFRCGFKRIIARHHYDNPASGRVMEKCGMHRTGMEKAERKFDSGELCDVIVYSIERP